MTVQASMPAEKVTDEGGLTNWAGNHAYRAGRVRHPTTVAEVQSLVAAARSVKALGTRHSFNASGDTGSDNGDLISVAGLNRVVALDRERRTVTVEAGIRYGELGAYLHREGFSLPNLASLPHISVGGACATATHGSGDGNASLAASVTALTLVTATGEIVELSRDASPDDFPGAVVALGALGVVTRLTLALAPTFAIRQDAYENLPLDTLTNHFDEITGSSYSVSCFTDWRTPRINQVWRKTRVDPADPVAATGEPAAATFFGATLATGDLHPVPGMGAENCTPQRGIAGPWHERLPHFRLGFTPSSGDELQTEYLVPRRFAPDALQALAAMGDEIAPLLQISEIRTIAADDLWLSPFCGRACVALHFTWRQEWEAVRELLPRVEAALTPFEARPHWGKLFTMTAEALEPLYPHLPDFRRLRDRFDPDRKFGNVFLRQTIGE